MKYQNKEEVLENIKNISIKKFGIGPLLAIFYSISEELKDDEDIFLAVFDKGKQEGVQTGICIRFASIRLRNDKNIALKALQAGASLNYFGTKILDDYDFMMDAVKNNGSNLEYANFKFRDDYDMVMTAVTSPFYGKSPLKYASLRLKNDYDIVLAAVKNGNDVKWASYTLKDDRNIALEALNVNGYQLESLSSRLRNDLDIVIRALNNNHKAFAFVPQGIRTNPEVLKIVINDNSIWGKSDISNLFNYNITPDIREARNRLLEQEKKDSSSFNSIIDKMLNGSSEEIKPVVYAPKKENVNNKEDVAIDPPVFPEDRIIRHEASENKNFEELSKKELLEMVRLLLQNQASMEKRLIDIQSKLDNIKKETMSIG